LKCKILILTILILSLTNLAISSNNLDELIIKNIENSIIQLNSNVNPIIVNQISKNVLKNSKKYNLSWKVIIAIIDIESEFNRKAKNNKCYGLMQINISAHYKKLRELKLSKQDLFHIKHNINLGCIILKEYIKETKNLNKALKKYSGGCPKYVKKVNVTINKLKVKYYANVDGKS